MITTTSARAPLGLLLGLAVLAPTGLAQKTESAQLNVGDNVLQDIFGRSVAVSEEWAIVGEPNDLEGTLRFGAVHFYRRTSQGWELAQTVHASDAMKSAQFGWVVAIDGGTAIISAFEDGHVAMGRGAVYMFELKNGTWKETQRLDPTGPKKRRLFYGFSVALDGDWALVTAPQELMTPKRHGVAYLYERTPLGWQLREKIAPRDPKGGTVFLGAATLQDDVITITGWANEWIYVLEHISGQWVQTAMLTAPLPPFGDNQFGFSLAYDAGTLIVGNRNPPGGITGFGSAFVYDRISPGTWVLTQKLVAGIQTLGPAGTDEFGASVSIRGNRILVGAPSGLDDQGLNRGQAYLFERTSSGSPWKEVERFTSSRFLDVELLGNAVALSESFALLGAENGIGLTPGVRSGTAYVYNLPLGESYCPAVANSTGQGATIQATGSVDASVRALELLAERLPAYRVGMFLVGRTEAFVPNPGGSMGNLCLGSPFARITESLASSGAQGALHFALDTSNIPLSPPARILAGESWSFQAWFRDQDPGPTSNFTDGLSITFR